MIGQIFNKYKVIGNINNRVALAHNPNSMEPWVVWWIDDDGRTYGGSYFDNRSAALNEFISRGFNGGIYGY